MRPSDRSTKKLTLINRQVLHDIPNPNLHLLRAFHQWRSRQYFLLVPTKPLRGIFRAIHPSVSHAPLSAADDTLQLSGFLVIPVLE